MLLGTSTQCRLGSGGQVADQNLFHGDSFDIGSMISIAGRVVKTFIRRKCVMRLGWVKPLVVGPVSDPRETVGSNYWGRLISHCHNGGGWTRGGHGTAGNEAGRAIRDTAVYPLYTLAV